MFNLRVSRALVLIAGVAVFSSLTWAASGEVSGYGGGSYSDGGDLVQVQGVKGGTSAYFGGTAGVGFGDKFHLFVDFGHGTLASGTSPVSTSAGTVNVSATQTTNNVGFGLDYGFISSGKVVPYAVGEFGIAHGTSTASADGITASGGGNEGVFGGGGGVRIFLGKSWGIKPEVKFLRYNTDDINSVVFSAGIFFQFGK